MSPERRKEIEDFILAKINSLVDWYCNGDAVDCAETRQNIRRDLDCILRETEEKYLLKPFKKRLGVRSIGNGQLKVAWEDRALN